MLARRPLLVLALALLLTGCGGSGFTEWSDPGPGEDGVWTGDDDDATGDDWGDGDDDDAADDEQSDDDDAADATDDDDAADVTDDDDDDGGSGAYEGDEPGECIDGADNDLDGWFDCDDVGCFDSPDCLDDGGGDDDDAAGDDDDATPPPGDDDDDDGGGGGGGPGAPAITSVTTLWNGSTNEFEFTIYMSDGDCDLGLPNIYWSVDGVE